MKLIPYVALTICKLTIRFLAPHYPDVFGSQPVDESFELDTEDWVLLCVSIELGHATDLIVTPYAHNLLKLWG